MGARKLVTLLLIAIVAVLAARYLFWNDRRDIRARLEDIAETARMRASDTPEQRTLKADQLGRYVADDVIVKTDAATFVGGRPAVVRLVMDGAAAQKQLEVSLQDVQVELIDKATATAFFTLNLSSTAPRQIYATLAKHNKEWLLTRAEVLRTLGNQ